MTNSDNHFAESAMLIRKPITEVFNAFIDPAITTKFWFTKSSGKLKQGVLVNWTWEMFNHSVEVLPLLVEKNDLILIQWGEDAEAQVEWNFSAKGNDKTFVHIVNRGFKGTCDQLISGIRDSTGGFGWILAGAKAYLEHNVQLNLIADRYPR